MVFICVLARAVGGVALSCLLDPDAVHVVGIRLLAHWQSTDQLCLMEDAVLDSGERRDGQHGDHVQAQRLVEIEPKRHAPGHPERGDVVVDFFRKIHQREHRL